jgi:hypothetical protein
MGETYWFRLEGMVPSISAVTRLWRRTQPGTCQVWYLPPWPSAKTSARPRSGRSVVSFTKPPRFHATSAASLLR